MALGMIKTLYFGSLIRKRACWNCHSLSIIGSKRFEGQTHLVGKMSDIISGIPLENDAIFIYHWALQNVNYLGGVSYKEIQKQINKATICVFPSFASLPVSWIGGWQYKKAIVASNIGWATEVIDDR
jgi:hypothetical protein